MAGQDGERALGQALRLLAKRPLTEAELAQKLSRAFPREVVLRTLSYLKERQFLDDAAVVEAAVRAHRGGRAWGRWRLKAYVQRRGVCPELFERLYDVLVDEEAEARAYVERLPEDRELRARRLLARGFSRHVVRRVVGDGDGSSFA